MVFPLVPEIGSIILDSKRQIHDWKRIIRRASFLFLGVGKLCARLDFSFKIHRWQMLLEETVTHPIKHLSSTVDQSRAVLIPSLYSAAKPIPFFLMRVWQPREGKERTIQLLIPSPASCSFLPRRARVGKERRKDGCYGLDRFPLSFLFSGFFFHGGNLYKDKERLTHDSFQGAPYPSLHLTFLLFFSSFQWRPNLLSLKTWAAKSEKKEQKKDGDCMENEPVRNSERDLWWRAHYPWEESSRHVWAGLNFSEPWIAFRLTLTSLGNSLPHPQAATHIVYSFLISGLWMTFLFSLLFSSGSTSFFLSFKYLLIQRKERKEMKND